jgi:paraquat-inducible protein B
MSDPVPSGGERRIQAPQVSKKKRRVSWIWLVPVVALVAGLSLLARTWLESGPTVTIRFRTAEGLEVGKTQVRYKDVVIGTVKSIRLNEQRTGVIVRAEITKDASGIAVEGTRFWVVRPRLGLSGVSGLNTLLSGAYIGVDAPEEKVVDGERQELPEKLDFEGLEEPPEVTHDRPGKRFTLKSNTLGSLDIGSPVYFRRIQVGQVIGYQLDDSGRQVNVQVFIDSPNDKYVTQSTHFWNASGVDVSVNADGFKVRTQSLLSVAIGGLAFEPVGDFTAPPAKADASFNLYASEDAAKAKPDGEPYPIRMRFDQSLRGLAVGAPVDFNGITIGQVDAITMDFDNNTKRFFAVVDATLFPERLGAVYYKVKKFAEQDAAKADSNKAVEVDDERAGETLLRGMVKHGLRAQLRPANLLTGQLFVALDVFPKAAPTNFQAGKPPMIPTVPGNLDQLQQQLANIVDRIDKIPFEKIGSDLQTTLSSASRLMNRLDTQVAPEAQAMLRQANRSLNDISNLLASDSSLPVNAASAMEELARAARSLRSLSDYLQAHPESLIRGRSADPAVPTRGAGK